MVVYALQPIQHVSHLGPARYGIPGSLLVHLLQYPSHCLETVNNVARHQLRVITYQCYILEFFLSTLAGYPQFHGLLLPRSRMVRLSLLVP